VKDRLDRFTQHAGKLLDIAELLDIEDAILDAR
jgi:hypothetical protein